MLWPKRRWNREWPGGRWGRTISRTPTLRQIGHERYNQFDPKTMKYDFDLVLDRHGTNSVKWDLAEERFGVKDVLPMWVADMDFRSPQPVIDALKKRAEHGIFGYAGMTPSYYQTVVQWMKHRHGWAVQPEWMVFSPGVVPALNALIRTFSEPGDQVIVQTPVYYPFFYAIERNGRRILDNPLLFENGQYAMDLDDLERKITPHTRMVLLCSPHNPIGRVWREEELRRLGELCLERDILVISDEIHQ